MNILSHSLCQRANLEVEGNTKEAAPLTRTRALGTSPSEARLSMRKYAGDIPKDPTHVDESTRTGEEGKSVQPNPDAPLPILESAPQTCLPSPIGTCVRARFVTTVHLSSAARRSVSACTWPSPPLHEHAARDGLLTGCTLLAAGLGQAGRTSLPGEAPHSSAL